MVDGNLIRLMLVMVLSFKVRFWGCFFLLRSVKLGVLCMWEVSVVLFKLLWFLVVVLKWVFVLIRLVSSWLFLFNIMVFLGIFIFKFVLVVLLWLLFILCLFEVVVRCGWKWKLSRVCICGLMMKMMLLFWLLFLLLGLFSGLNFL